MNDEKLLRPEEAIKLLICTVQSLINWTNGGKLQCIRTKGNHRRFLKSSVIPLLYPEKQSTFISKSKRNICYYRVSTSS